MRWWEAGERPEAELLAVMKHVRFVAMSSGFLRETVGAWPALRSAEARDMLFNAVLPAVDGTKVVPRSGFGPCLIYVVGGKVDGDVDDGVELYDPKNSSWTQLASMTAPRIGHGCVALDGKLYAVGGSGAGTSEVPVGYTAEVYDPQADRWQPLADMSTVRCGLTLAAVGGKIYAIGGYSEVETAEVSSVEAYDPQLGAWAPVADMSVEREWHASVVLDGKIYAMGGAPLNFAQATMQATVEVYDPQADSWQRVASMPQGRCDHAAAAMGGKIYVSGGSINWEENDSSVSSLFVYDPRADAWTQLASMGNARRSHTSVTVGGKLYVGGGCAGADSWEVYNPASDSWTEELSLTSARDFFEAVVL